MASITYDVSFRLQLLDGLVEWESVLELRSVVEKDYTEYSCTATNTKGSLTTNHTLTPPLPPPTPTLFQVSPRPRVVREFLSSLP